MSPMQRSVLDVLTPGPLTLDEIKEKVGRGHGPTQAANALVAQGRVEFVDGCYRRLR